VLFAERQVNGDSLQNSGQLATGGAEGGDGVASIAPSDLGKTFLLHSRPSALHTIYLDFDGHTTLGTNWNAAYGSIETPAYDFDGDTSSFSDAELERIQKIWERVVEDFLPFDVNVTTQDPGTDALIKSGGGGYGVGYSSRDWWFIFRLVR